MTLDMRGVSGGGAQYSNMQHDSGYQSAPQTQPAGDNPPYQNQGFPTNHNSYSDTSNYQYPGNPEGQIQESTPARDRANQNGTPKEKTTRLCRKCEQPLTGQFVRALKGTFHLDCFRCEDCNQIVASKFFPVGDEQSDSQYPLCERDYFRRLDLLCSTCGEALRGSYVTALDHKYHVDHFTCSICPTSFGAEDSYYEHDGQVYCHFHYSTQFAQRCSGCQTAILKQFVEIFRNGQNQHWHPECYMIHKFWNVKVAAAGLPVSTTFEPGQDADDVTRKQIREQEEQMEERVYRIWSVLSGFEETSASCISDMLLHVSNGSYVSGVMVAKKFIQHVEVLFTAIDKLDAVIKSREMKGLQFGREAKLLCKKIVAFFALLTKTQDNGVRRLGVTQELLSLVTSLAHYLKLLIRISLQGALKLEKERQISDGLHVFLDELDHIDQIKDAEVSLDDEPMLELSSEDSDRCAACQKSLEDEGIKFDDPNLGNYDSSEGHRLTPTGELQPTMLSSAARSKSYGGIMPDDHAPSSYEETVGEMKRMRSTRMDQRLSTTLRRPRTSRLIEGNEASQLAGSLQDGIPRVVDDPEFEEPRRRNFAFDHENALTLDDLPRIVAAEQAKEQRPNAYRYAQNSLISNGRQPRLLSGGQRDFSSVPEHRNSKGDYPQRTKRYFSELSALEFFIVRHIAVLQMQPLLEGHHNLEYLLGLIESRNKPTFWNKFGKAFNKGDKSKSSKKKGVFGISLEVLTERDGVESTMGVGPGALRIPQFLDDSISAMKQMDMSVEGVFRKNGNIKGLRELAEKIDAKEVEVDFSKETPVQLAALLKKWLREMPDPLLTHKLYELFTTSQKITDEAKKMRVLHLTCCLLPRSHRDAMEILCAFLNWAASFSQVDEEVGSKMDSHNLATVIAPNILSPDAKGPATDESFLGIEAVWMLIENTEQLCEVPEDIQSVLTDTDLFQKDSEITTKEILKRYGEIARTPGIGFSNADGPDMVPDRDMSAAQRTFSPRITHADQNSPQAYAQQHELSVRHVQNSQPPAFPHSSHNTPPQQQFDGFPNPHSPYHQRNASTESARSSGALNRFSRWGKSNNNSTSNNINNATSP